MLYAGTCQNELEDECATACPGECAVTLAELQLSGQTPERRRLLSARVWEQDSRTALLSAVSDTLSVGLNLFSGPQLGPIDAAASASGVTIPAAGVWLCPGRECQEECTKALPFSHVCKTVW